MGTGIETVEPTEYDRCLDEVKKTWQTLLNRGMKIRVPEQRINDAYRAWLAYTFLNVDKLGDLYIPHDGAGFYEELYGIIAATYCRTLDAYGYPDKAQLYLNSMLATVRSDGEFRTDFGVGDNGWLLMALEQHYQFTRDQAWLVHVAPTLEKMGQWIIARRGEPQKAILALYASMAYGMSRNTYSGVEVVFDIRIGQNDVMMPHLRSGTQQLRLLRSMLVREDGDRLILVQAVPQHWLKSGQHVEVLDAMTTFGQMSYTIKSEVDHGKILVHLVPPERNPPKNIQLYVRHPEKKPILSVSADGRPITSFGADSATFISYCVETFKVAFGAATNYQCFEAGSRISLKLLASFILRKITGVLGLAPCTRNHAFYQAPIRQKEACLLTLLPDLHSKV